MVSQITYRTWDLSKKAPAAVLPAILRAIEADRDFGDIRTVDSHVARLRTKLGSWGADNIKTVYGTGYKIEAAKS